MAPFIIDVLLYIELTFPFFQNVSSIAIAHQTRLASNKSVETPVPAHAEQRPSVALPRTTLFAVVHLVIPETRSHLAGLLHHQLVNE